jgi:hypothetical protein
MQRGAAGSTRWSWSGPEEVSPKGAEATENRARNVLDVVITTSAIKLR